MRTMKYTIPEYWMVSDVYVRVQLDANTKTVYATGQTGNAYELAWVLTRGTVISKEEYEKGMKEFRKGQENVKDNPPAIDKILTA